MIVRLVIATCLLLGGLSLAQAANESDLQPNEALVGFGIGDITPPLGAPLAGYGGLQRRAIPFRAAGERSHYFRGATSVHDPVQARAMLLERNGDRLAFVRLDLVAVTAALTDAIRERVADLGIPKDRLIVSATHTHSGPGAWVNSELFALVAVDSYRPEMFDRIVTGAEKAIRTAFASRAPATLMTTSLPVVGLQNSRFGRNVPVDTTAHLLLARSRDGLWRGGLVNYAIHPTVLAIDDLGFSPDVAGSIERSLAAGLMQQNAHKGPPVTMLFLNGSLGDVSPNARMAAGLDLLGQAFAGAVWLKFDTLRPVTPEWSVKTTSLELGPIALPVMVCLGAGWITPSLENIRVPLPAPPSNRVTLEAIRIGDIMMMTWPGEPTTGLGAALKETAAAAGAADSWVIGLAGDYKGYFSPKNDIEKNKYVGCANLFGAGAGERVVAAYQELLGVKPTVVNVGDSRSRP
ncbi:MAG: neutral/alkaline non-lysosomal ceramidase N-terminal domain-containing protein [Variibacter sp.]